MKDERRDTSLGHPKRHGRHLPTYDARQLSPLFNADKSYDPVNIGYLTKASAYKEKVRMEKLRKQLQQAEDAKKS